MWRTWVWVYGAILAFGTWSSGGEPAASDRPPWQGNRIGITDEVLAPWTPVQASGDKATVWGRTYRFGPLPLPASVVARGQELLSAPITLAGSVEGTAISWSGPAAVLAEAKPPRTCFRATADAGRLRCHGEVCVEYDGMVRCDLRLVPQGKVTLNSLALEIPLKAPHALFLHTWPGRWGSAANSTALAPQGHRGPFKPFVWLGDHWRGLSWFAECDRNFFPESPDQVLDIRREGDVVRWRIVLVGKPQSLDKPLEYTFGFQATPVKPAQPDAWDFRIVHMGNYGLDQEVYAPAGAASKPDAAKPGGAKLLLDHLAESGVRTICFHEHWSDIQNYPRASQPEALSRLAAACHKRHIQLLLYFGYEMSTIAPEWPRYSEECLVAPRAGGYKRKPEQTAYIVCYRSHWQDFLAEGIDRILAQHGVDGVYLDGTSEPWGCTNQRHGCGYRRPDGSIGATYPFFATRQMMKRIYTIVKHRNPAGQVNVHQSTCMTIPTLAFATSYWDGEQLQSVARKPSALELLPLDAFCAEFMGHNWGVPAELLWYGSGPFRREEAVSLALLHDVPVRPSGLADLEHSRRLWQTFDALGRHQAQWIPYWQSAPGVKTSPPEVKISLYNRPGRGLLVVLVNLGTQPCEAEAEFDFQALGQPARLTATDVLAEKPVPLADRRLRVALGSLGHAVVWLRAEK